MKVVKFNGEKYKVCETFFEAKNRIIDALETLRAEGEAFIGDLSKDLAHSLAHFLIAKVDEDLWLLSTESYIDKDNRGEDMVKDDFEVYYVKVRRFNTVSGLPILNERIDKAINYFNKLGKFKR